MWHISATNTKNFSHKSLIKLKVDVSIFILRCEETDPRIPQGTCVFCLTFSDLLQYTSPQITNFKYKFLLHPRLILSPRIASGWEVISHQLTDVLEKFLQSWCHCEAILIHQVMKFFPVPIKRFCQIGVSLNEPCETCTACTEQLLLLREGSSTSTERGRPCQTVRKGERKKKKSRYVR